MEEEKTSPKEEVIASSEEAEAEIIEEKPKPTEKIITHETAGELDSLFEERETENQEKVEAALFIAGRFLNIQDLIMLTDINPITLKEVLIKLERKYSRGAIVLVNRNNSWKMDVSEKYTYMVNKLATGSTEFTKAEQETLAVIAYKQPIKQSVVIKIRGNKAYDHIAKFIELGLLQSKKAGHTNDLMLTEEFYEYFNVQKRSILKDEGESEKEEIEVAEGEEDGSN
jgi:segregation and condensation protein B